MVSEFKASLELKIETLTSTYKLTKRERDVLRLVLQGLENTTILEKLCISDNTFRTHIKSIYKKLNIKSQRELFRIFITGL